MNHDDKDAWGHSLRTLSWDKDPDISKSQNLISDTVHEWYDAKHPPVRRSEVQFLNSLPVSHCPICGSEHFIRYGFYKDVTRGYDLKWFLFKQWCKRLPKQFILEDDFRNYYQL